MIRRILNKVESVFKYRYFSKNEKGAYNFLLKKVYKSTDIDFIENIWQLDYFREVLVPQELVFPKGKNILILAPHQDDEIIGCGGTILKLLEANNNITIGFLTDGAELSNPTESITIRQREAKAVSEFLGCEMLELGIDNISMGISKIHVETLKEWLSKDWDFIFSIWPVDQPPKHRICSYLLGKALSEIKIDCPLLFYAVHTDLLPNFYVDISNVIDEKHKILKLYESQIKNQNYSHLSRGLDAWRSRFLGVSNEERYIETLMKIPPKAYNDFQKIYDASNINRLFKGNGVCIRAYNKIKKMK